MGDGFKRNRVFVSARFPGDDVEAIRQALRLFRRDHLLDLWSEVRGEVLYEIVLRFDVTDLAVLPWKRERHALSDRLRIGFGGSGLKRRPPSGESVGSERGVREQEQAGKPKTGSD